MRFLGNLPGEYPTQSPRYLHEDVRPAAGHMQDHLRSQHGGLFFSQVHVWDRVEKDQLLGCIVDPFGDVLQEVRAPEAGRILTLRVCPRVLPGEFTAVVVPFAESDT